MNGLPLIQVELKKRGVAIREAFNQINRYSKESFNSDNSLYKYLQIFVISNGTDSRYFANTTKRNKNSFDFTMNWAKADNTLIKDLKDFTATFFQKNTILRILLTYSVFDTSNNLLIMRPYQIAATERILWKIKSSYNAKKWGTTESGGYIWHTTGSGKTLTSFKAARLATELDYIDKVFFVVDRKDLDYQTMKEYQRFSPDSVNGSENTIGLKRNIEKDDNKIIVTTIQKMNNLIKSETNLEIYNKQVVFIFDEAHRSQFGEAQKNIKKKFKRYYQFGFTGTPIFPENALGAETTASVFGRELHSYVITDAIRDEKVLKFKVDYNDVRPKFKDIEMEQDEKKLTAAETKEALLHPERIREISQYILDNFRVKTHRAHIGAKGFNAMFAVSSVEAAKLYYETLNNLQKGCEKPLTIATIFSFAANEEQNAIGEALEIFKSTHFVSDEDIKAMQLVDILEERTVQDYRSKYNDIREWIRREREGKEKGNSKIDWDDVVFEVDLLKSQEINLDYILELIYEKNKNTKDKNILIDEIRRIVRASTGNRAKESLIVAFINQTDLDEIQDKASIIDAFFQFAQMEQKREAEELIMEEKLNEEAAKRYILTSLRKEYASENGTDLNEILPKMSPLNPQYHTKKQSVFEKISTFVEKFKGVGGVI